MYVEQQQNNNFKDKLRVLSTGKSRLTALYLNSSKKVFLFKVALDKGYLYIDALLAVVEGLIA